jgi:hypothetical protein
MPVSVASTAALTRRTLRSYRITTHHHVASPVGITTALATFASKKKDNMEFDKEMIDFIKNTPEVTSKHLPILKKILKHQEESLVHARRIIFMAEESAEVLRMIVSEMEKEEASPFVVDSSGVAQKQSEPKSLPAFDPAGLNLGDLGGLTDGK